MIIHNLKESVTVTIVSGGMMIFSLLSIILYIGLAALGIYCIILLIKLMIRGIKLLDIMIDEKTNRHMRM